MNCPYQFLAMGGPTVTEVETRLEELLIALSGNTSMPKKKLGRPYPPAFREAVAHVLSGDIAGGKTPAERIRVLAEGEPLRPNGTVFYWMHINRRWSWNYALDRALEWVDMSGGDLVILETLPFHQTLTNRHAAFILQGMRDFETPMERGPALYRAHSRKCGRELTDYISNFADMVDVLIVDDHPDREYRRFLESFPTNTFTRVEAVDSSGLIPFRSVPRLFPTARGFRSFVLSRLPEALFQLPDPRPLSERLVPRRPKLNSPFWVLWRKDHEALMAPHQAVNELPIDHSASVVATPGGPVAARARWQEFLQNSLTHYHEHRNHPDDNGASGMAPYLHFGFISPHEMVVDLLRCAVEMGWSCERTSKETNNENWWGLPPGVAAFLDQLLVWRELGLNLCHHCDQYDRFESLPEWAQKTLTNHASDRRPIIYTLEQLEFAQTHDRVWNAAQNELRQEGRLHNYLRMLWGKKILEWTPDPQTALEWMIYLNNKYALDGSDPNSYTGITWILGRYDRAWGPERPIFGLVRYMSTDSARRKLRLKKYLERYAPEIKETQS